MVVIGCNVRKLATTFHIVMPLAKLETLNSKLLEQWNNRKL